MFDFIPSHRQIGIRQRSLARHCKLGRATELVFVLATGATLVIGGGAEAATFAVTNEGELAAAINSANANAEADTITLSNNITLTTFLPTLEDADGVTIDLGGNTLSGNNVARIFFVGSGTATIENGTLADGLAQGGDGGNGDDGTDNGAGGGGMGAGGALYVRGDTAPTVTVSNVSFSNNDAIGGDGGTFGPDDGGQRRRRRPWRRRGYHKLQQFQ